MIVSGKKPLFWRDVFAMILGSVVLYVCGLSWLKMLLGVTWSKTLAIGMFPFLAGDAFKIVAAASIAKSLRPVLMIKRISRDAVTPPEPAGTA
jgi:biotin transport system substrate-specific component